MTIPAVAATGFPSYFLSWEDVISLARSSESTIRRAIRNKKFPPQVKLFGNRGKVAFRTADIYLWCEGRWTPEGGF